LGKCDDYRDAGDDHDENTQTTNQFPTLHRHSKRPFGYNTYWGVMLRSFMRVPTCTHPFLEMKRATPTIRYNHSVFFL
jgi:hypothetical protein